MNSLKTTLTKLFLMQTHEFEESDIDKVKFPYTFSCVHNISKLSIVYVRGGGGWVGG